MIDQLVVATLGLFFGKYRGGIFKNRDKIVARIKNKYARAIVKFAVQGDTVFASTFATLCIVTHKADLIGYENGLPVYLFAAGALVLWFTQFVMSYRGSTPGWGEYIGAAAGTRTENLGPEVEYIDEIIEPLRSKPRLWGIAGLSLRCGEWGFFIAAPLAVLVGWSAFMLVLVGLMAGPTVFLLSKTPARDYSWIIFEALLGAGFWLAVYNA